MKKPIWIHDESVYIFHDEQLAIFGGKGGVRDEGLLESALARPQHLAAYGDPDIFNLAAAYAFGIVSNHPFIDGNKRTGFLATYSFLWVNGWHLQTSEVDAYMIVMSLAQKEISESTFADWLRKNAKRIKKTKS